MNQTQSSSHKKLCALMADDDPGIRLTLSALLKKKGYCVTAVENGAEAVNAISDNLFDIVLLDIMMPVMDGFEACRSIRDLGNGKNVPVLMLTGQDDNESIKKSYDVGATDFVAKPINYSLLGFRIDYIIRTSIIAEELRKSQQRANNAQRIAHLGHLEWGQDQTIEYYSKGISEILQLPENAPLSSLEDFIEYVHSDDKDRVKKSISTSLTKGIAVNLEHRIVCPDGRIRFVFQISEDRIDTVAPNRMVVTMQDVTDRVSTEKRLHILAYYDKLTGLPNRSFLINHLDQLLKVASRYQHSTAVIVFGVDNLDKIVESFNHDAVEDLIRKIADRIKGSCRNSDLLSHHITGETVDEESSCYPLTAKLRNDEYVIVLSEIGSLQSASIFLLRLIEKFGNAFHIQNRKVYVTVSAGISVAPIDGNTSNELIKFAEIAKGFAAKEGAGSYRYFKQSLNDQVTRNSILANDFRNALHEGMLEVYYQPKMSLTEYEIVGVEALTRWQHPTLGTVSPVEFIAIAEDENLISQLGEWVLETACKQVFEWNTEFNCQIKVSINISPKQLLDKQGMGRLFELITDTPISNQLVELELTESTFLTNFEASLNILKQFVELGCGLAIDDFGTGYSSLSYLGRLPAKVLKIDKSFIDLIETSSQYAAIVKGIIQLAHSLGMAVIAEGVETNEQMTLLSRELCDEIQGNLISLPLPPQEFNNWLKNWNTHKIHTISEKKLANSVTL